MIGGSGKTATVADPSIAYRNNAAHWEHLDALLGGTIAMRAGGTKWLPKEDKESDIAYRNRLARSILFGGYEEALSGLVSKPFSRPVSINGEAPEPLADMEWNIDNEGRGLTEFARDVFRDQIHRGITYILVDFPDPKRALSAADQRRFGIRPYFCHVLGSDLIGWTTRKNIAGRVELSQIRIAEKAVETDGDFGEKEVSRVRVWNAPPADKDGAPLEIQDENGRTVNAPGTWELWEERDGDKGKEWQKIDEGKHTFPGIPLVPVYAGRTGFLQATPPLEDLGWLNIAHWQSTSDQRNILRFARTYTPYATGVTEEDVKALPPVGVNSFWTFRDPDAKVGIVEHSGASITAGERDIKALEERMEVLGLQPMLRRSGDATATAKAIDEARGDTDMQSWVRNLEAALLRAYEFACIWAGEAGKPLVLADDFAVDVFSEFGLTMQADSKVKALLEARKNGDLSRETFLRELIRIKYVDPNLDPEQEEARIEKEAAAFMELAAEGASESEEEEEDDDAPPEDEDKAKAKLAAAAED